MKKILILTNNDAGFYNFRKEIITVLREKDNEVYISVPDTGHIEKLRNLGAEIIPTDVDRRGMNPVADLKLFGIYRRLIKKIQPDAVLTYTIKPNVYGGVAARWNAVPFLPNVTGLGTTLQGEGPVQTLIKGMYKVGLKGAKCVFFQNEFNLEFMKEKGCISENTHTRLLPGSGVNLEEYSYLPYKTLDDSGELHLLYVGRIMNDKGSRELLEMAETIHNSHSNVIVDIVGAYEEETKAIYEPWINRLSESGAVKFHGFHSDMTPFYEMCQALVHPTYHEGMSNVVLEAAASGRPVITSDIPGCREIYENGYGGLSFESKSTESLVETVEGFLSMEDQVREKMGKTARYYVEQHFDRNIVMNAYLEEILNIQK